MSDSTELYTDLVSTIIRSLVGYPDHVEVEGTTTSAGMSVIARVHPDDAGRIIGKGGATIEAVRRVIEFAARRHGDAVAFELADG